MKKELTQLLESNDENEIKNLIYTFRDKQVMLDSELRTFLMLRQESLISKLKEIKIGFLKIFVSN